jgi:hypothetical protein
MPWGGLEPRGIPLLDEGEFFTGQLIGRAAGRSVKWETDDVFALRYDNGLSHRRAGAKIGPIQFQPRRGGGWQSALIDFGKVVHGRPCITVEQGEGGEILDLTFYETLDASGTVPDSNPLSVSHLAMGCRATLCPGSNRHQFFHAVGFRYAVVTLRQSKRALDVDLTVRSALYPVKAEGRFRCSDKVLESIWECCAWTQRICSLDAFVDTPWREQAQWWGDSRVQAWNTFQLSGDTLLFRRGIRCLASQTAPSGLTYGLAPTNAHHCILPDFSLFWLLTLWDYYWQTGSLEPFLAHRTIVDGILNYFLAHTDGETGLVSHDPRYWLFLDWSDIPKTGRPAVLSLWYLVALEKITALLAVAGQRKAASTLKDRNRALRLALRRLVDEKGLVRDGYDIQGNLLATTSIHTQTLALATDLEGLNRPLAVDGVLMPLFERQEVRPSDPSSYWMTYVFDALRREGRQEAVVNFIRERWACMAEFGSTWERFQPDRGSESFSHAWSAHPLFHLPQIFAGIEQTAPGWKRLRVTPWLALPSFESITPTPHGPVEVRWHTEEDGVWFHFDAPSTVRAELRLPEQFRPAGPGTWHGPVP